MSIKDRMANPGKSRKNRKESLFVRELRIVAVAGLLIALLIGVFFGVKVYLRRGLSEPDELYAEAIIYLEKGRPDVAKDELLLALNTITEDVDASNFDAAYVREKLAVPAEHKISIMPLDIDRDDKEEVLLSIGYPYNMFAVDFEGVGRDREKVSFIGMLESWYEMDIRDLDNDSSVELIVASGKQAHGFLTGYRIFRWLQGRYVQIASIGYEKEEERLKNVSAYYRDINGDGIDEIKLMHFATYITPGGRVRERGDFIILAWNGFTYSPLEGEEAKIAMERFSFMSGIVGTGIIRHMDFEGGFYGIISDDGKRYDPVDLPDGFKHDGLKVSFFVEPIPEASGFHMWGSSVKVVDMQVLQTE